MLNPADIERAIALLGEKASEVAALSAERRMRTGSIEATCDECGRVTPFPAARAGRTESCPQCHRYIDVPDPDAPVDDDSWRAREETDPLQ